MLLIDNTLKWIEEELKGKTNGNIEVESVQVSKPISVFKSATVQTFAGTIKATDIFFLSIPVKDKHVKKVVVRLPLVMQSTIKEPVPFGFTNFTAGTIVKTSAPSTIVVKDVRKSFFNISSAFLPFSQSNKDGEKFDGDSVWKEKKGWNPLVEKLNLDEALLALIGVIPHAGKLGSLKIDAGNTFCQVIPSKKGTAIMIAAVPKYEVGIVRVKKVWFSLDKILEVMEKIAAHLEDNNFKQVVEGLVEKDWGLSHHLYK